MKRLIKKKANYVETAKEVLDRLESGEQISFEDKDGAITFQEVRDVISKTEVLINQSNSQEEIEEMQEQIAKIRQYLNEQYKDAKQEVQIFDEENHPEVTGQKTMTIFAGTNGGGKSTVTQIVRDQIGEIVDVDHLMRIEGLEFGSAGKKAIRTVNDYIEQGINFSVETTLGGSHVFGQIERAKEAGYEIVVYYVGLISADLHMERIKNRVSKGGHHIPDEDVLRRYITSVDKMGRLVDVSDKAVVIDNSGTTPIVVCRFENGEMTYSIEDEYPDWVERGLGFKE